MAFYRGQKVVCIDASGYEWALTKGKIYTVTSVVDEFICVDCIPGEIFRDEESARGYYSYRFRPVIERKTDISIFTAMLNPEFVPHEVPTE